MSLKPLKKSDMNKSWMKSRQSRKKKFQPEYHLVVSEGIKTEPNYFTAIKNIINSQYREKIQLDISGEGDNTINLFEKAKIRARENPNIYRHVWIVYDTDDFPAENIDLIPYLCHNNTTEETEYHAIWSNQCMELWYLLHFSFMHSDLHREEYYPKLNACLNDIGCGNYRKNRTDMYEILRPYMDEAIYNAKKLNKINEGKNPSQSSPGTKIYELIEKLKLYL